MIEKMPGYYRKSRVMNDLIHSIENEFERLNDEITLTENQFFVILSDRNIKNHEADVGLVSDSSASLETRRSRVLSKLRGTGTVTKTMMKNVSKSFVNGDIEIIEYPSKYCFAVKFTSKTDVPYNLEDIKAENLAGLLKRNDIKKSEAYQSGFLEGTVPMYDAYMNLKKSLIANSKEDL